ncbi:TonB-dependent siderophore receptor [Acetobacter conturbans]|uniref:TonB-dependent siderophore receptor n=1 Tax=Acetobacter conturbans TaxID=1737472 RepID=A0ABX0JZV9_9PROT|nr:TonB-dependent siderophore receptor [Acetobacter conturbans]NHN87322.1 TonB-dependent siderophore receptor [Acetobacter conturbans]
MLCVFSPRHCQIVRHFRSALLCRSSLLMFAAWPLAVHPAVAADADSAPATALQTQHFNIPSQPLARALATFGVQTGTQIAFDSATVAGAKSGAVNGQMTSEQALSGLLAGTNIGYQKIGSHSVSLHKLSAITLAPVRVNGTLVHSQKDQMEAGRAEEIAVLGLTHRAGLVPKNSSAATKTDTPLIETPESVSVITRAQLDQQNARTIAEALRYSAGVSGDVASGYTTRFDMVEIRGFQGAAGADEFVDNLRLFNGAYYATQQIDPYLLERIDILKGPPSVLYGQSNPGGAIVLTTKQPTATPIHSVSIEGGTYGYVRGTADFAGRIDKDGKWLYRIAATGTTSGTQDLHTRNERVGILPSLTWAPNDRLTMTLSGFWQRDPRGGNFDTAPLQGTILPNPNGKISRHFYPGDPDFETYSRTQKSVNYHMDYKISSNWTFKSLARYANVYANFKQISSGGMLDADDRTLEREAYASKEHYDTVTVEEQILGHFMTGPVKHQVIVGGNWQNLRDSANLYEGDASSLDVFSPTYGQAVPNLSLVTIQSITTNQEGVYGEDQMTWGKLHVQGGVRHDWSRIDTRDAIDDGSFNQSDQATTWRAGILYAFDVGLSPYFHYAESFQPTNSLSFSGTPFKPTRGKQFEVGLKYQPRHFNGFFTVALYDLKQSNVLVTDPEHLDFYTQAGGIRSRGIEVEAHVDLTRNLNIVAAYTYQDVAYTKSSGAGLAGERPTSVPKQTFSIWGHYDFHNGPVRGLGFGVGVRYNGNTLVDNTLEYVTPSYTLVDAQAQYAFDTMVPSLKGLLFQVTAQNLLNKRYYPGCASADTGCYIGANRNVIGKVTYNW